jgi:hypothetical protein
MTSSPRALRTELPPDLADNDRARYIVEEVFGEHAKSFTPEQAQYSCYFFLLLAHDRRLTTNAYLEILEQAMAMLLLIEAIKAEGRLQIIKSISDEDRKLLAKAEQLSALSIKGFRDKLKVLWKNFKELPPVGTKIN